MKAFLITNIVLSVVALIATTVLFVLAMKRSK